jgi:TatA/E family protein of Tat protein translocase
VVNVGPLEILLVAIIALIVLGPARLPEVARSVGRGMREFRSALTGAAGDDRYDDEDEDDDELEPPDEDEDEDPQGAEPEAIEPPPLPRTPPGAAATPASEDLPEGR